MKTGANTTEGRGQWYLEAAADANREWMVAIEAVPFVIGREKDCNLTLTDSLVSRHHCEIHISGDHLWIRDLNSKNGTFVNSRQMDQAELLKPGDLVSIGKFQFNIKYFTPDAGLTVDDTLSLGDLSNYDLSLEPRLRAMIAQQSVIIHFQPVFNISSASVLGYEILGRTTDENLPADATTLFDMAEWFGCDAELSSLFREAGVGIGKHLPGSPLLFVNATSSEISRMDRLVESLGRVHDLAPANRVVLELNEKAANDTTEIARLRTALNDLNMGLAFDDFGVGQTRLAELAKAPPDFLKFDISLIRKIHLAPKRLHQMVATFVTAARDLEISSLAEGIECAEEADVCRNLGFQFAQGFFYGRPLPINEIHTTGFPETGATGQAPACP
ncbi:EAL domain-containing protein [Desulfosudis oleivorans]|uniref:Diguanylate phosphodiesterase n=1 Tax=Desulfosudis oleivorans (strain DSM 6200 / JCM 39069 / Hxd3) TaxID=96561 RepID=A8ZZ22_DESOH|nr:EAL domain-containing protein [Desulfosudis oleivorans]ABW68795.1 diguanylate phosphodiesterase [Desulfosudis oleivorans Hxd3]